MNIVDTRAAIAANLGHSVGVQARNGVLLIGWLDGVLIFQSGDSKRWLIAVHPLPVRRNEYSFMYAPSHQVGSRYVAIDNVALMAPASHFLVDEVSE